MYTIIETREIKDILPFLQKMRFPDLDSHKGNNGKALIIGGSTLFHSALIWSAEILSHFVDMVHVSTVKGTKNVLLNLKSKWHEGIVIETKDMMEYVNEDNTILVGNGMMRTTVESSKLKVESNNWEHIMNLKDEGLMTRAIVEYLITHFPDKQYIFDAGALQMMDAKWLLQLHKKPIVTPHLKEFYSLFGIDLSKRTREEKCEIVEQNALRYKSIILLKAVDDMVTNGLNTYLIQGGNAGLTKGGTGDILAGLAAGLSVCTDPFSSTVLATYIIKKTADELFRIKGYWYNTTDVLRAVPFTLTSLLKEINRLS